MPDMEIDELLYDENFEVYCSLTGFDLYAARSCQEKLKQGIASDDQDLMDEAWDEWKLLTGKDGRFDYCKDLANSQKAASEA